MRHKLLLLAALAASFGYGAAAARYQLFPYPTLRSAASWVAGWFGGAAPARDGMFLERRGEGAGSNAPNVDVIKDLANVPYLRGFKLAQKVESVTMYDPDAAMNGLNLVISGHGPEAMLQDMRGNTLHSWRCDLNDAWQDMGEFAAEPGAVNWWRRAHVYPDGALLAIFDGVGIIKLDRESNLLWEHLGGEHHDLDFDDDGNIWVLTRRASTFDDDPRLRLEGPIKEDFITVLSPGGEVIRELSVLASFVDSDYSSVLANAPKAGDILHTNTLELMDGRFADRHPMFEKGNLLISCPMPHAIAVIDPRQQKVVWAMSGMWSFQHQPTVLDSGRLLIFDNLGEHGHSKVIEFDPFTQEVVWSYRHTEERRFSSYFLGSASRLPNGNTLITESTEGRAFEVTPDGTTVWNFNNPKTAGDEGELVATVLEVVRIDPSYFSEEFGAAHNAYAAGERVVDPSAINALIKKLER